MTTTVYIHRGDESGLDCPEVLKSTKNMEAKPRRSFPKILKAKAIARHNTQKGLRKALKEAYYHWLLQMLWETETEA